MQAQLLHVPVRLQNRLALVCACLGALMDSIKRGLVDTGVSV